MKNKKTAGNYQSSIVLCQPSCGYYFSSGLVVSETIYSSAAHGPIYNAASRVIIDGGRKVLQTAALGGMLAQNFTLPAYAGDWSGGGVLSNQTSTINAGDIWTNTTVYYGGTLVVSRFGSANGITLNSNGRLEVFSGGRAVNISQAIGGRIEASVIGGDTQTLISGINENGAFSLSNGEASGFILYDGAYLVVSSGGRAVNISQAIGGRIIGASVIGGDTQTLISGINENGAFSLSGGMANNFVVNGSLEVYRGGTANSTTVGDGFLKVYSGGIANITTINSGGDLIVGSGGIANSTIAIGILVVSSGGTVNSATVNSGGLFQVDGGTANSTTINSYGCVMLFSSSITNGTVINSLGLELVRGGSAISTVVNSGGSQHIKDGGYAIYTTVNSGGYLVVSSGGTANSTIGHLVVSSGGTAINTVNGTVGVYPGGSALNMSPGVDIDAWVVGDTQTLVSGMNENGAFILSGGLASNFVLHKFGYLNVGSGGIANSTTLDEGELVVSEGGTANSTTVNSGILVVWSDGIATSTTVNSGGSLYVFSGGTAYFTIVSSGGRQVIISGGSAMHNILFSGAVQSSADGATVINNIVTAENSTINSGTHTVASAEAAYSMTVSEDGNQNIENGGLALSTIISGVSSITGVRNAMQHISSGGIALDTEIYEYGEQYVHDGGTANNTVINAVGRQVVSSGGIVSVTIINSGGKIALNSGGKVYNIIQSSGGNINATVKGGDVSTYVNGTNENGAFSLENGVANNFVLNNGGVQYISSGGIANSTTVNFGGAQRVSGYGTANNAVINDNGSQIILAGGLSISATINSGGKQYIESAGVASDTTINVGGWQYISAGGSAVNNIVGSGGSMVVYNSGVVSNTVVESGGSQIVSSGGETSGMIISGTQYISSGAVDTSATVVAGGYQNVLSGGIANNATLMTGGAQTISSGGLANNTVVNSFGNQIVSNSGRADNTVINENGSQVISSGGLSISATINSGGKQYIESAGVASDTTINVGGWQYVSAGGSAVNNIVGSGGSMVVYNSGVVSNTVVESGGSQIVSSGGETSGMIISGTQYVSSGAVDTSATVVAGGYQNVLSGGIANNATLMTGGAQTISSGGLANNTVINSWGFQTVCNGGTANSTTVNSAGILSVSSGGSATNIIQHSGGQLIFDIASSNTTYITGINERGSSFSVINGVASNVIVNNKGVYLHDGGILYNYIATSNGNAPFGAGGSAINVIQETGGDVSVDVGTGYDDKDDYIGTTYITGTNQYGQSFSLVSGVASNFVINEHGYLDIYSGGKAYGTIINSGYSAGQKEEPGMTVYSGGSAISTVVKSGGSQLIEEGGYAIYTTVSSGGKQTVESGGIAISNFIYAGGIQNVEPGAIVQNAVISGGGSNSSGASIQVVSSGATASNIIIGANAVQQINDGGLAISAVISSGGEQNILSGGTASGTVIYKGGTQKIGSSGYASGTVISQGGAMELASGGFAAGLTVSSGGTARISGTNTLFSDNELQNGGSMSLVRTDVSAPAVLTFENLYGNGTIDIGIDFSNPAESDKIVISGIHNGNTILNIKTIKGGKPVNDDSLKVVDCSGATETGTFSLKGGKLDTGWYEYTLDRDIHDYYLRSNGEMTNVAKTAIAAPAMGNVSINVALNSLQKRLGDLRNMGNSSAQHGTWARGYYQSLTLKEKIETEMKISGIEAGYDFRLSEEGSYNGEGTYLGIMAGKSIVGGIEGKGRTGRQESKGEGEGILGGAYLTYIGESGFFADFTARAGTNKLDLSAYSESEGGWIQFSPERTFIAASMEAGKSFGGSAWKIEPKAEMRYMNIGSADAEVKGQPEKIKFGGASYITAIGTLNAAYSWKRADGMITQPYAEVSYSQELSGEEEIKYSGNMDKSSMKGGFIEGRIGINMQMSDNLYWHAAAGIESGSRREGFGADAGIRYMFGGHKQAKRQTDNYWKDKDKTGTKAVSAEKKADDKAITALPAKPATVLLKAVNAEPGNNIVTTEKEEYLEKADRAEKTISKEVLKIPPMGLLFQIGKMAILSYYTPMLDAFAKLYLLTDQSSIIYVEGFSSNGGNETKNNPNLSKERAMNVAYYLMSKGIKGNKILVKPYGNSKIGSGMFANDSGCSGGGCYRRVNISIK